ncbi:DUF2690 domain-containing protein [Streptomyces sp. ZAF1911]|uniref:DUF2690 domain-containing protein n=1 Tax=unclassified Streptomyces TaxID=2593676 RepID=UPI00237B0F6A|nr:DUF2690 domain-containing protein [Streptomyces sp. ZAF1911]MDD9381362.1 DUF2690 domain-containing protein [Streptomyces sp. ZAF1911]
MQFTKKAAVLTAGVALFAGLGLTGTTAHAAGTAGAGVLACSTSNAVTPIPTAKVDTITIELRYSTSSRCAWGRITTADPGDQVWVDRSSDGGRTWAGPWGVTTVQSGTDTHTPAYNDAGYKMRACAKNDSTGHVHCTGWY